MVQRKGRTLKLTVDELLESVRFRIAIDNFDSDPMFMKAILIELGNEAQQVAKNKIIREYNLHSSLDSFELTPYLRSVNDFDTYNIWWNMSDLEKKLYMADPKNKLSKEEKKDLLDKLKEQMMGS